jgi:2-polyprenyl-3-methyl-5-hydroxy-6-metoxy-1,4-benzoquinol methylase
LTTYDLLECPTCRLRVFDPVPEVDYASEPSSEAIRHYVEIGAGLPSIWSAISRRISHRFKGSVLDVGCGYGFSLDLVETLTHGTAIGVEPSVFGVAGSRDLGVRIVTGTFPESASELPDERFDIVIATEVVEHVDDPISFVTTLAERLKRTGVLILTTPNGRLVDARYRDAPFMMPILDVGTHTVLFTASALEDLVRHCGMRHVRVLEEGVALTMYATSARRFRLSRHPLPVDSYYELKLADPKIPDSLRAGLSYRQFREKVNRGDYASAARLRHAISIPEEVDLEDILTVEDLGKAMRFCAPCASYYRAFLTLYYENRFAEAAVMFNRSFRLLSLKIKVMPSSSPEERGLVGWAKVHEAVAWERAGELEAARMAVSEARQHMPGSDSRDEMGRRLGVIEERL